MNLSRQAKGFTIIELLIVLTIVGIFGMIAVPGFLQTIQDNRLTAQANDMLGVLYFARSEAIKLHDDVQLCSSSDGATCTGGSYENGWIIWNDADDSGTVATSEIIRIGTALEGGNEVFHSLTDAATVATNIVTFTSRGLSSAQGTWQICDSRGAAEAKAIVLSLSGRAKTSNTLANGGALTCS